MRRKPYWVRRTRDVRRAANDYGHVPRQKRASAWCKIALVFRTGFLVVFGRPRAASRDREITARFPCGVDFSMITRIRPLANDKALCDRARMRTPFLSLLVWGLASCASEPVHIAADRCWSVSVGDEVQGSAFLYIASPFTFHVGPKVAGGPDCPSYQIQLENDVASRAYGEIEQKEFPDDPWGGPKERMVTLSGIVVSGKAGKSPIIRITQLRFSTATEPHTNGHDEQKSRRINH